MATAGLWVPWPLQGYGHRGIMATAGLWPPQDYSHRRVMGAMATAGLWPPQGYGCHGHCTNIFTSPSLVYMINVYRLSCAFFCHTKFLRLDADVIDSQEKWI